MERFKLKKVLYEAMPTQKKRKQTTLSKEDPFFKSLEKIRKSLRKLSRGR